MCRRTVRTCGGGKRVRRTAPASCGGSGGHRTERIKRAAGICGPQTSAGAYNTRRQGADRRRRAGRVTAPKKTRVRTRGRGYGRRHAAGRFKRRCGRRLCGSKHRRGRAGLQILAHFGHVLPVALGHVRHAAAGVLPRFDGDGPVKLLPQRAVALLRFIRGGNSSSSICARRHARFS